MLQSVHLANSGRTFVSTYPIRCDDEQKRDGGFRVPVNLSAEEIREIVRELMG